MEIRRLLPMAMAVALMPVTAALAAEDSSPDNVIRKSAVSIPEPADLALFAAGVAGLIIGRRSSRSKRRDD